MVHRTPVPEHGACLNQAVKRNVIIIAVRMNLQTRCCFPRKNTVVQFLRRAVTWFRRKRIDVQRVMTDNGSSYRSRLHAELCHELGIRHIRTRPYTPRTNGKAERFIGTLSREWAYARSYRSSPHRAAALADWIYKYNHLRPHRGLGRSTPQQRLKALR